MLLHAACLQQQQQATTNWKSNNVAKHLKVCKEIFFTRYKPPQPLDKIRQTVTVKTCFIFRENSKFVFVAAFLSLVLLFWAAYMSDKLLIKHIWWQLLPAGLRILQLQWENNDNKNYSAFMTTSHFASQNHTK